tara:strand:- start:801 stop:1424 length:624 start_codon:yes stop_codon:yes gene_type:complete
MTFNGRSIIIIGTILFCLQLINFFSIDLISPSLQRAQVLSALSSIVIILIGLLFDRIKPVSGVKASISGTNGFDFDKSIPQDIMDELAWGSECILTSTAAASVLIRYKNKNILKRGIITDKEFQPGDICNRVMKEKILVSLVNTKFYPGKDEFDDFCKEAPSILIIPIDNESFILIGGWSSRCFTKSDEKWLLNWSKKLNSLFKKIV